MATDRCVRWSRGAPEFWESLEDKSVEPNVVISYACRSQWGEGFEELMNSLNSEEIRRKISHVHIWDTSYLYRRTIPEFAAYSDVNIPSKWFAKNGNLISKLRLPYTLHSWADGLNSKEFDEYLGKVKVAFAGDEDGNGVIPDFRQTVLDEAEKSVLRGHGTFAQNVSFILEECAYTCLYFKNDIIIYPQRLSPPIVNIVQHFNSNIRHLSYTMSNHAQRHQHRSLNRNELNYEIIDFITNTANNINFFVIDTNGVIVYKNESLGKIVSETDASTLDPKTWKNSLEVINSGMPMTVEEADKGKYFLTVKAPLVINEEVEGVIGLSIDITDSKRIQIEKEKVVELEFRNKLQQTTIDFQTKFVQFVSRMAHDIASPLASLEIFTKNCANLTEKQRRMLENITSDIRNISSDLLQRNKFINDQSCDLSGTGVYMFDALSEVVVQKKLQYKDSAVDVRFTCDPGDRQLYANLNETDFKRMISNLINNAVEACEGKDAKINVSLTSQEGKAVVEVRDNGRGMSEECLRQINSKVPPKSTKRHGFGLGLAQVLERVKEYRGEVEVSSASGKGTTFRIKFPLATPKQN